MAKGRSRRANGGGAARMRAPPSDSDRIIDAALACIARQGWRRLSLADIAAEAGLPVLRVYRLFSSKTAILRGFFRPPRSTANPTNARATGFSIC